jgi:enoyl-CoA hydratase
VTGVQTCALPIYLGLIPGYAGTQRLPRLVGLSNALYLLMTADMINAEEAFRIGLVQKVVEPDKLMEEAITVANKIAQKGKIAIKMVKQTTIMGMKTDFDSAQNNEAVEFGNLFGNGESGEGMKAFLEKRKPNW